jgi:hypothetical protein
MVNGSFYEQEEIFVKGMLKYATNTVPSENLPFTLSIR